MANHPPTAPNNGAMMLIVRLNRRLNMLVTRLPSAVRYLLEMRKPRETPEEAEAKRARLRRAERIRSGSLPGLLENGAKAVRPEIRKMIDAAIAKRGR